MSLKHSPVERLGSDDHGRVLSYRRYRESIATKTFLEYGHERLGALSASMGVPLADNPLAEMFARMMAPWGGRRIGTTPLYPSDASNDYTPFEFSMAFGPAQPELRLMVEALGERPSLRSNQAAGRELTRRLHAAYGMSLHRYELVEDLFFPDNPRGVFSVWHAAGWTPGKKPEFKLYFNLHAHGRENAPTLLREAMARLGFAHAWRRIYGDEAAVREDDELTYFSLDLADHPSARIKVYTRHHYATTEELEKAASVGRTYVRGDATLLCRMMARHTGPFTHKPPITTCSFTDPKDELPSTVTLHFPVATYAPSDREAHRRIYHFIVRQGLPPQPYVQALEAFKTRPLSVGRGMQSYASFRRDRSGPRVTVYLGPEAYSVSRVEHDQDSVTPMHYDVNASQLP